MSVSGRTILVRPTWLRNSSQERQRGTHQSDNRGTDTMREQATAQRGRKTTESLRERHAHIPLIALTGISTPSAVATHLWRQANPASRQMDTSQQHQPPKPLPSAASCPFQARVADFVSPQILRHCAETTSKVPFSPIASFIRSAITSSFRTQDRSSRVPP